MDKIDELLTRGVDKIYPSKEVLEKVLRSGKKLTIYYGIDPTGDKLHIGHMVPLQKIRQLQDLGHKIILLLADFTAMIGDPSGKTTARKQLTHEEVLTNAKDYKEQASKILRFEGENPIEIKYSTQWWDKMSIGEFLKLCANFSGQQIWERDMFVERVKRQDTVWLHELLYPVLQGYDSIAMGVDMEIGGTDQTFNMLAGRTLLKKIKNKEKFVLTVPLLTDSSGNKIGKTEGNVIALTAPPNDFYGMIMSLSDDVIDQCFEYITDVPMKEVERIRKYLASGKNPMQYKKLLAFTLTKMLNSEEEAKKAQEYFEKTHQKNIFPEEAEPSPPANSLLEFLKAKGYTSSEAKHLIDQGAVDINGATVKDRYVEVNVGDKIKVGKKTFYEVIDSL